MYIKPFAGGMHNLIVIRSPWMLNPTTNGRDFFSSRESARSKLAWSLGSGTGRPCVNVENVENFLALGNGKKSKQEGIFQHSRKNLPRRPSKAFPVSKLTVALVLNHFLTTKANVIKKKNKHTERIHLRPFVLLHPYGINRNVKTVRWLMKKAVPILF